MNPLHAKAITPNDLGVRSILLKDKHVEYILGIFRNKDSYEHVATEHFKMSGIYWALTALDILGHLEDLDENEIIEWVMSCQHSNGGFGGSERHDPHILYTLSAVQIMHLYGKADMLDKDSVVKYVASLQQDDGSFIGDEWGEVDTRFSYCALSCCSLLGRLESLDVSKAVDFVVDCMNFDGGFGCIPGNESHAGQVFCCIGSLSITGTLNR